MHRCDSGHRASGFVVALFVLGACNGGQSVTPPRPLATQAFARPQIATARLERELRPDSPAGWSPKDLQSAYALPSSSRGSGQVVAIVDAFDNPNAAADLAVYRTTFGLPAATFYKYNQQGQQGNYPQGNPQWGIAIDNDIEMVSASCPKCTINLIEASSNSIKDLETAVLEAVTLGAHVVGTSWACSGAPTCLDPGDFDTKGVVYLGSGAANGTQGVYPADLASVVAVGGTQLSKGGGKRGWTERVWSGASGGCIADVGKPAWQHLKSCTHRAANDVSAVAFGVAEYDSYGYAGWIQLSGTAVSSPLVAGIFGLAGNATKQDAGKTFWSSAHLKYLNAVDCGTSCVQGRYSYGGGWGSPNGIGAF